MSLLIDSIKKISVLIEQEIKKVKHNKKNTINNTQNTQSAKINHDKKESGTFSDRSKYWLSLEQWSQDKDFRKMAEKEFISPPLMKEDLQKGLWGRRDFLKLMGASLALAGFGCVRRPAEKIVPYVQRPDDVNLGKANFYSSSYYDGEEGFGILVKTREGRPIKIEGNKDHPINRGSLSARAHSHLLSLYDPERLKNPQHNVFNKERTNREFVNISYSSADREIVNHIKKGKTAFLTGEWPSPSSERLLQNFCKTFNARHFVWNPLHHAHLADTQKICYGKSLIPRFMFNRARLIVSINCDFLGTWLYPTEMSRLYSQSRKANRDMNQLVVFESLMSLTGSNADLRVRISPSHNLDVVLSLIYSLIQRGFVKASWPTHLPLPLKPWEKFSIQKESWDRLVQSLWDQRGQSLILAGGLSTQTEGSESLHIAVQWLNHLLNNDGWTINYQQPYRFWKNSNRNIEQLIEDLEKEKIQTLVIHKTNPIYNYPNSEHFQIALKKAKCVVYTGDREDETGRQADYILPDHHDLEKWSDWEFQEGVISIQQPTIRPLYRTRAFEDSLITWAQQSYDGNKNKLSLSFLKGVDSWYKYLKRSRNLSISNWNHFLKTGVLNQIKERSENSRMQPRSFRLSAINRIRFFTHNISSRDYELILYVTNGLKDGTLANVSWLQEFPDPVTKICWDNYFCVSPAMANKEGWKEGQVIQVHSSTNKIIKAPVHIQPGQADKVIALALGYGRKRAGQVANHVGVNGYSLASVVSNGQVVFSGLPVRVSTTRKFISLANVQGHHSMEGRQIVVETALKRYLKNPGGAIHRHKLFSMWSDHSYPRHKWGMVIDLNTCTGCSACVTACQSENNIPTVGKNLILQGREMHWIRIDRYYKGSPDNPKALHQPVVCMHCDNAPCETVCPVAATVHSDEGTNDMIYNRCVGTRYCSNNCPYKVRRFNWFNYTQSSPIRPKGIHKAMNPEVTVRSRGVMEKCTFCIHRVRSAQAQAKLEGRPLKDGDVQTACQQSCPTQAITFGDLKDQSSQVSRLFNRPDAYSLLEELNTKPAVRYRVKVRNTNKLESSSDDQKDQKNQENHHG